MVVIENNLLLFSSKNLTHNLYTNRNGRKSFNLLSKKTDLSENSRSQQPIFPLKLPSKILGQSLVAVFGLGFIDAGYSGDWSRIGVISKESEDLLKVAAFLVIPLCIFLIFSISKEKET